MFWLSVGRGANNVCRAQFSANQYVLVCIERIRDTRRMYEAAKNKNHAANVIYNSIYCLYTHAAH